MNYRVDLLVPDVLAASHNKGPNASQEHISFSERPFGGRNGVDGRKQKAIRIDLHSRKPLKFEMASAHISVGQRDQAKLGRVAARHISRSQNSSDELKLRRAEMLSGKRRSSSNEYCDVSNTT